MICFRKTCGFLLFVTSSALLVDHGASTLGNNDKEVKRLSRTHHNAEKSVSNSSVDSVGIGDKSAKLLPFLVVVNNSSCNAQEENRVGTCYTPKRCRSLGGKASGTCASGFGVCCIASATCDSIVSQNGTMFFNPGSKSGFIPIGPKSCSLRITKPTQRICQFRLDFIKMDLAGTDTEGHCPTDSISIFGVDTSLPQNLCGPLTGQHMYLEFGSSDQATMVITTDGTGMKTSRSWEVQVTYVECDATFKPPPGCLQYFTEHFGQVQMLGYPMKPHLAGLHYTICVRAEENSGSIFWFPCQNEPVSQSFLMTGAAQSSTSPINISGPCTGDYILIMTDEDSVPTPKNNDRYCGNALTVSRPFTVLSRAQPFIVRVNTDMHEGKGFDVENTGFCLGWLQNPSVF